MLLERSVSHYGAFSLLNHLSYQLYLKPLRMAYRKPMNLHILQEFY